MREHRDGFALIAVLWIIVAASLLSGASFAVAANALRAHTNRVALIRATWIAQGCVAVWLSDPRHRSDAWDWLDRTSATPGTGACAMELRAVGSRLDVARADSAALHRLALAATGKPALADSVTAALLDWQDVDDAPRALGAERPWYWANRRRPADNAPLRDEESIQDVRSLDTHPEISALLGVDSGRIALRQAPSSVLFSLRGVTAETVGLMLHVRDEQVAGQEWDRIAGQVSATSRDSLRAQISWITAHATWSPDAWLLRVRTRVDAMSPEAELRVRLARRSGRLVPARQVVVW